MTKPFNKTMSRKRKLHPENEWRAASDNHAIGAYKDIIRGDKEDTVCDLIASLGHWCDREGFDFLTEIRRGLVHWQTERLYPEGNDPGPGLLHRVNSKSNVGRY